MAIGRDLQQKKHRVVSVIGDGALTGGLAFEALNHNGSLDKNMLVIFNDICFFRYADWSISKSINCIFIDVFFGC